MKFLDHEQVIYYNIVDQQQGNIEYLPGLMFDNKLFIKDKHFTTEQKKQAQDYAKQQFLLNKGQKQYLVLEDKTGLVIWKQDDNIQLADQFHKNNRSQTSDLEKIVEQIRGINGIQIKERRYLLNVYPQCFIGSELVDWMVKNLSISTEEAVELGQKMVEKKWIHHVLDQHNFKNEYLFYRFYCDENTIET